jgi:8-oxo-dGTP pyrophosphatase MutT (NUDIX family)
MSAWSFPGGGIESTEEKKNSGWGIECTENGENSL